MKRSQPETAAFSLVEVTLALGVAAFAFLAIMGMLPTSLKTQQAGIQQTTANSIISQIFSDLRADLRLPPGQYRHLEEDAGFRGQAQSPFSLFFRELRSAVSVERGDKWKHRPR